MALKAGVRLKNGKSLGLDEQGKEVYEDDYINGVARDYAAEYLMANSEDGDLISSLPESEWGTATKNYVKQLQDEFNKGKSSASSGKNILGQSYSDWTKGNSYSDLVKRYKAAGKSAMDDTVGTVAARTGGYASSYAETAGQQAYNNYMESLEDAARSMYEAERADALENYNLKKNEEATAYERAQNEYNKQLNADALTYEKEQDSLANEKALAQLAAQYGDYSKLNALGIDTSNYGNTETVAEDERVYTLGGKQYTFDELMTVAKNAPDEYKEQIIDMIMTEPEEKEDWSIYSLDDITTIAREMINAGMSKEDVTSFLDDAYANGAITTKEYNTYKLLVARGREI